MTRKEFFGIVAGIAVAPFVKIQHATDIERMKNDFWYFVNVVYDKEPTKLQRQIYKRARFAKLYGMNMDCNRKLLGIKDSISTVTKERRS